MPNILPFKGYKINSGLMRLHWATCKHSIKTYFQYVKNVFLILNAFRVNSNIFIHKRFHSIFKEE